MNNLQRIAKIILWACIEDYAGLWELLWEVNTVSQSVDEDEHLDECQGILRLMVERGIVQLYHCQEPYGELNLIGLSDSLQAISASVNWKAPELNTLSVRAGANPLGTEMYKKEDYSFLN